MSRIKIRSATLAERVELVAGYLKLFALDGIELFHITNLGIINITR